MKERRAREREARRRAILTATRELVRENGFAGTTTRQIAERCELSEATLFFYFSSKDEILVSLLGEAADFWASGLDALADGNGSAGDRLAEVWRFFEEVHQEHPEYVYVSTYLAQPGSTSAVSEEVLADLAKRTGANFRRLGDLLVGLGGVDDRRLAADVLWSSFLGLMVLRQGQANLGAPGHPDEHQLPAALDLLARGFSSPTSRES
ncbi:MAG: TetR/AcrR family transcriptional regulator [Acidimicrobiia bacterium]